uniref:Ig-like domain-containing protein n=1 Tax=Ornithorhynchus anatinus TaxID=9258 RepID=A0A6I8N4W2_ORNAN
KSKEIVVSKVLVAKLALLGAAQNRVTFEEVLCVSHWPNIYEEEPGEPGRFWLCYVSLCYRDIYGQGTTVTVKPWIESLVESGGAVKPAGESLRLSCTASSFIFGNSEMDWYRQAPGREPEWVSHIDPSGTNLWYAEAVRGRFSISRDNTKGQLYLQMDNLQVGDSGRYYCVRLTVRGRDWEPPHKPLSVPARPWQS